MHCLTGCRCQQPTLRLFACSGLGRFETLGLSLIPQVVDWRGPSGATDVAAAFAHFSVQGNAASGGLPYWRQAGSVSLASPSCPAGRAGPRYRVITLSWVLHTRPCWRQADSASLASQSCPADRAGLQDRVITLSWV